MGGRMGCRRGMRHERRRIRTVTSSMMNHAAFASASRVPLCIQHRSCFPPASPGDCQRPGERGRDGSPRSPVGFYAVGISVGVAARVGVNVTSFTSSAFPPTPPPLHLRLHLRLPSTSAPPPPHLAPPSTSPPSTSPPPPPPHPHPQKILLPPCTYRTETVYVDFLVDELEERDCGCHGLERKKSD